MQKILSNLGNIKYLQNPSLLLDKYKVLDLSIRNSNSGYKGIERLHCEALTSAKLILNKIALGYCSRRELDTLVEKTIKIINYKDYNPVLFVLENNKTIDKHLELERHSLNVTIIAGKTAKAVGVRVTREFIIACLLHDIGKYSIDSNLLFKKDKLSTNEFNMIKTHTIRGFNHLNNLKYSNLITITARNHHEKYDGSGYPDKHNLNNIKDEVQLISICDMFEAMTSERVYKASVPAQVTLKILKSGALTNTLQEKWVNYMESLELTTTIDLYDISSL